MEANIEEEIYHNYCCDTIVGNVCRYRIDK